MDLELRKYHFIQELFSVNNEEIINTLELVLKNEREQHIEITPSNKKELDKRLKMYHENPNDLLDWDDVKNNW
tara:strand:+ start:181 stop:399 length:219 start_codon:yes stop_codon:yes gene_type:complete